MATMIAADELLVITTPDYPTLSCTMHAIKIAKERKTPITGIILNKMRNKSFELTIEDIEDCCKVPVIGYLPDDISMLESLAHSKPVSLHSPLSNASIELHKLAAALVNQQYKDPRFFSQFKQWITKDVRKDEVNRDVLRQRQNHW